VSLTSSFGGNELSKVLAILLVETGSYTYNDKLSYSVSKELALYNIRELLRDFYSLRNKGVTKSEAKKVIDTINFSKVEEELNELSHENSVAGLREKLSLICSMALAEAARIKSRETYNVAKDILTYLKQQNYSFSNESELKKLILEKINEISKVLNINHEVIEEIANNQSLIYSLIRGEK